MTFQFGCESNPTSIFLDKVFQLWALACLCGLWGKAVGLPTGRLGAWVRFNKASRSVFDTKESLNTCLFWSRCFLSSAPKLLHLIPLHFFFFNIYLLTWLRWVLAEAHRISLHHMGSCIAAHRLYSWMRGLCCPAACGSFVPWTGIEPAFPELQGRFLTVGPPKKSFIPFHSFLTCLHAYLFFVKKLSQKSLWLQSLLVLPPSWGNKRSSQQNPSQGSDNSWPLYTHYFSKPHHSPGHHSHYTDEKTEAQGG